MHKINIYGVYPPPFGGISIHIKRFVKYLENENYNFEFYQSNTNHNEYNNVRFRRFILSHINFQKEIIHLHGFISGRRALLLLLLRIFFRKKRIVTIHNNR
ncbi:MAG: glycosyl transferase, partial [Calditrichaeota bacterium]